MVTNTIRPLNNSNKPSYQSISTSSATTNYDDDSHGGTPSLTNNAASSSSCGTGVLAPMKHLTRRDRQYRWLVGGILIVVLMVLTSLAYIAMRPDDEEKKDHRSSWEDDENPASAENDNDDDATAAALHENEELRAEQVVMAFRALQNLNRHVRKQSRFMPTGCETTLLILRHCEELGTEAVDADTGDYHCSYLGYERARYIGTLFGNNNNNTARRKNKQNETITPPPRWPTPSYLYALTDIRKKRHKNYREWETLRPLAESIGGGVEIHMIPSDPLVFTHGTYIPMLKSGDLCDRLVVVSWKHSLFPDLANAVGCGPDQGCPTVYGDDDYDSVWEIKLVFVANVDPSAASSSLDSSNNTTRSLYRKKHPQWYVYGTVVPQGFDPLAFEAASYRSANSSSPPPRLL